MKIESDDMVSLIKEIGSDPKLLSDFLAKLSGFIALSTGADKFNCVFDTTKTKKGVCYTGVFKFHEVKQCQQDSC